MIKKILLILFAILLTCCAFFTNATITNTKQYTIKEKIIESSKISPSIDGTLIAYFSDLHYGKYIDSDFANRVLNTINSFNPDIIIFGGDLINNSKYTELQQMLTKLDGKYGKYAILGEDDNSENVKQLLLDSGFMILDNETISITINKSSSINLVGLNSLNKDYNEAFSHVDASKYTLVVSHFPDTIEDIANYQFDYMLAGHSLGGEVYLPIFSLFNRETGCEKYYHGKYNVDGKTLDITNGVGRDKYNARLFADSEIVLYTLKSFTKE